MRLEQLLGAQYEAEDINETKPKVWLCGVATILRHSCPSQQAAGVCCLWPTVKNPHYIQVQAVLAEEWGRALDVVKHQYQSRVQALS
jgi:hypothetical protein